MNSNTVVLRLSLLPAKLRPNRLTCHILDDLPSRQHVLFSRVDAARREADTENALITSIRWQDRRRQHDILACGKRIVELFVEFVRHGQRCARWRAKSEHE